MSYGKRLILLIALGAMVAPAVSADLARPWSITVQVNTGQGFLGSPPTIDDDGVLTIAWQEHGQTMIRRQIKPADLAEIQSGLAALLAQPPQQDQSPPQCCDMPYRLVIGKTQGRELGFSTSGMSAGPESASLRQFIDLILKLRDEARTDAENEYWAKAPRFQPGKVWEVVIEDCSQHRAADDQFHHARWERQADTNTFSAVFVSDKGHREIRDTVTLDSIERQYIRLTRQGTNTRYDVQWDPEKPTKVRAYWFPLSDMQEKNRCGIHATIAN